MARSKVGFIAVGLLLALVIAGGMGGASRGLAQDATPAATVDEGRPVHIHAGSCADGELGDIIAPLSNLTAPAGDALGQDAAVVAETSFTNVPLTLDAILAEDHAINAHLSTEEIETYIACGEIGGPLDATGSVVVGLREQNGSGFTGIAFLSPGADGVSTNVSVFLAEDLTGGGADAAEAAQGATVEVSLSEWTIDMPDTLPAGRTTFNLTNDGEFPHTIEVEGEGIEVEGDVIEPGQSTTLEVDLQPGTYVVYCPVGDGSHRARGMELELTVE